DKHSDRGVGRAPFYPERNANAETDRRIRIVEETIMVVMTMGVIVGRKRDHSPDSDVWSEFLCEFRSGAQGSGEMVKIIPIDHEVIAKIESQSEVGRAPLVHPVFSGEARGIT